MCHTQTQCRVCTPTHTHPQYTTYINHTLQTCNLHQPHPPNMQCKSTPPTKHATYINHTHQTCTYINHTHQTCNLHQPHPLMPALVPSSSMPRSMQKLLKVSPDVQYVDLTLSFLNPSGGDDIAGPPIRYYLR